MNEEETLTIKKDEVLKAKELLERSMRVLPFPGRHEYLSDEIEIFLQNSIFKEVKKDV